MTKRGAGRCFILSGAGLVCIMLLVSLASASTLSGKTVPAHPEKATQVPVTTQTPTVASTSVPAATQTPDSDSASLFSNPAVIAAGLGLASAVIGAGATLYTHAKKK